MKILYGTKRKNIDVTNICFSKLFNNNVITILSCDNNILSSLNVNNMTSLTSLSCVGSALPTLSLTTNTNLIELKVNNNQLSSLNLNNNTALLTAGEFRYELQVNTGVDQYSNAGIYTYMQGYIKIVDQITS